MGRSRAVMLCGGLLAGWMALGAGGARAVSLTVTGELAAPGLPSVVAASGGTQAWVVAAGPQHRFAVTIRARGHTRRLGATSAVGWIDGLKLGTDSRGRQVVVYSHCPHDLFAPEPSGRAGTDGCRLWWAPTSGGPARLIAGAPPDASVGVAARGTVTFVVQPNTAYHGIRPPRLEQVSLAGGRPRGLAEPGLSGREVEVEDIAAAGSSIAFIEDHRLPSSGETSQNVSEIWLQNPRSPARIIQSATYEQTEAANDARYYQGLTLTESAVYAFLYAEAGVYPPTASLLERVSLPGLLTSTTAWAPAPPLSSLGINGEAFDPSDDELTLATFSWLLDYESPHVEPCSHTAVSARACPVVQTAPAAF